MKPNRHIARLLTLTLTFSVIGGMSNVAFASGSDSQDAATVSEPAETASTTETSASTPTETHQTGSSESATADSDWDGDLNFPDPLDSTGGVRRADDTPSSPQAAPRLRHAPAQAIAGTNLPAIYQSNDYGAHWDYHNSALAFFNADDSLFARNAQLIIDVSKHQGVIDWEQVKASGVKGAIIRIGFGWADRDKAGNKPKLDEQAARNIAECKRLGIPFGVYTYSYAYDPTVAKYEGEDTVARLRQLGVSPSDLAFPVVYDLEGWTDWKAYNPPTSPDVYEKIMNAWWAQLEAAGFHDLSVYSYHHYLYGPLKKASIWKNVRWYARVGGKNSWEYPTNLRLWQYSASGSIPGINTAVDLNAFGDKPDLNIGLTWLVRDHDVAVGAAVESVEPLEYRWLSYNVSTGEWKVIADWSEGNWASWKDHAGAYWLHAEVRSAVTKEQLGSHTIAFNYKPSWAHINGTYAGYRDNGILLGESSDLEGAQYKIKIYDYGRKTWVAGFNGQWALWQPEPGIYWTHFELYTKDGKFIESKTYAFGV